jgi:hemerythrin
VGGYTSNIGLLVFPVNNWSTNIMDMNFDWDEAYSIGVDEIDIQHKQILSLIKKNYLLAANTIENNEVKKLLDELNKYMRYHFSSEELLMQIYEYPKYTEQKIQHDLLIRELSMHINEIDSGKGNMVQLLFTMMKWFIGHDNEYDKEFGKYLKDKRK